MLREMSKVSAGRPGEQSGKGRWGVRVIVAERKEQRSKDSAIVYLANGRIPMSSQALETCTHHPPLQQHAGSSTTSGQHSRRAHEKGSWCWPAPLPPICFSPSSPYRS